MFVIYCLYKIDQFYSIALLDDLYQEYQVLNLVQNNTSYI